SFRNFHFFKICFMRKRNGLLFTFLLYSCQFINAQQVPVTKKQEKVFSEHGHQRIDNYYWLSDRNDSNVINHLKEENAYVESYMKKTEPLQKKLYDELVARIPQADQSLPVKRNGYWYYTRYEEGKQYPYYARKKGSTITKEEILLDVPEMAKGHKIFMIRGTSISKDNNHYAYGIDTLGDRR